MHPFWYLLQGLVLRAVEICRLLTLILREYRESGPCGLSGCHG
ncbi:hypothetical protein ATI02_2845 [Pseudomonas baetica]|uniref:Uncharacterized protein n=1 Tax=Pseudomonas baetica TaxID=674054 RepID=A0ABX4PZM4_9PSED|nr:hypothetical protein ATI02_2845 [Pseudomonas baetica]